MKIASVLLIPALLAQGPVSAKSGPPWTVRADGVGPVTFGMSLRQLNKALHSSFSLPADEFEKPCFYVSTPDHKEVQFMIEEGRVARADIGDRKTPVDGIRIGDPQSRIYSRFGSRVRVEPSAYDAPEGQYFTVLRGKRFGVRFEVYRGVITGYYAGTKQAIQLIEGCS